MMKLDMVCVTDSDTRWTLTYTAADEMKADIRAYDRATLAARPTSPTPRFPEKLLSLARSWPNALSRVKGSSW